MQTIVVPAESAVPRAAVLLFHGGALRHGGPEDLEPHCRRLARHGILAVSAGYRLATGQFSIDDSLLDVRTSIRRFRDQAAEQGLEPSRLAVGGSSAGAHLAMVASMTGADPPVGAIVALNPAGFDLAALPVSEQRRLAARVGVPVQRLRELSLTGLVRPGLPDMLIQHGTDDEVEPIAAARRFRDRMIEAGNRCTLREYEGRGHGFHYPRADAPFDQVIDEQAEFILRSAAAS